jgi:hypothetical protein
VPRPQAQPQRPNPAPATPAPPPASAGKVMYFHKPTDALVPLSGSGGGEPVAQAVRAGAVPDASALPPLPVPPPGGAVPVPDRPLPALALRPGQPDKKFDGISKGKEKEYTVLPAREKIFVIYDDEQLERMILKRLRDDEANRPPDPKTGKKPDPYVKYPEGTGFPTSPDVGEGQPYRPKTLVYAPMQANYDAIYVVHRRLHFEDKNSERYGWDLGIVQPFVSAMIFYKDVLTWPNSLGAGCAYGFWDTSAGKCLPGSPTPYMLYPPALTITGSAFESVIITGAAFAFP